MKGHPISKPYEKLVWLRNHPELWCKSLEEIKKAMANVGLCSQSTYSKDLGISVMIAKLKLEK